MSAGSACPGPPPRRAAPSRVRARRTTLPGHVFALGLTAASLLAAGCGPSPEGGPGTGGDPGLVVLVVVDQLRADHLTRNADLFDGGFRTLEREGWSHPRTTVDHALTNSAPGHATLATGLHPSRHGIVDNAWVEGPPGDPRRVSAVSDPDVRIVGDPEAAGRSPARRLARGLADWALAADGGARAVAVGQGAHSTNALAAREGGHAYWFSGGRGRFVTSTWYRERLPGWVRDFHRDTLPELMADSVWELGPAADHRGRARDDAAAFEADGVHVAFPHRFRPAGSGAPFGEWFATTPMLDRAILALARAAVRGLDLGARGSTDVLALNLSSLDEAGHAYGPRSLEQLDALLRLDGALGELLAFLDREVGREGYVLALSADHGAPDAPEAPTAEGIRVSREAMVTAFDGVVDLVEGWEGPDSALATRIAEALESESFVADVLTPSERAADSPVDSFPRLFRNSHHPERGLDFPLFDPDGRVSLGPYGLAARLEPGAVIYLAASVHGSPYLYDRSVPLHFLGRGVPAGASSERGRTVDVAPTLAVLSGIPLPQGLDGRVLGFVYGASP